MGPPDANPELDDTTAVQYLSTYTLEHTRGICCVCGVWRQVAETRVTLKATGTGPQEPIQNRPIQTHRLAHGRITRLGSWRLRMPGGAHAFGMLRILAIASFSMSLFSTCAQKAAER